MQLKKGRGYASSGPQIKEFTINNKRMGQTFSIRKNQFLKIKIGIKAPSKIKKVVVVKNGIALKKFYPSAQEFTAETSTRTQNSSWYSLEVYTKERQAFANAIWVNPVPQM